LEVVVNGTAHILGADNPNATREEVGLIACNENAKELRSIDEVGYIDYCNKCDNDSTAEPKESSAEPEESHCSDNH
jgi:hypothetical protein